jgi:hypothetical protein
MHKMSKESASTLFSLQKRLSNAENILKDVLDDEKPREYLIALVTTHFSHIKNRENSNE